MHHEPCPVDAPGAEAQDVNLDGRADSTVVPRGKGGQCQALDFNFDGHVDSWIFLDASGQRRRSEADFDRDGRLDEIVDYEAGVPKLVMRATTLAGRLDTWQHWEGGRLVSAERDSDGDALVDQWWEFAEGRSEECPLVHSDVNRDGRPDPGASVDLCEGSEAAEGAAALPPEPSVPVETNQPSVPVETGNTGAESSTEPP
jgi:hypothetical protein